MRRPGGGSPMPSANSGSKRKSWTAPSSEPKGTRSSCFMPTIKTVAIISKPNTEAARALVPDLVAWLRDRGIAVRIDRSTAEYAHGSGIARDDVPEGCDLVIVLGGD